MFHYSYSIFLLESVPAKGYSSKGLTHLQLLFKMSLGKIFSFLWIFSRFCECFICGFFFLVLILFWMVKGIQTRNVVDERQIKLSNLIIQVKKKNRSSPKRPSKQYKGIPPVHPRGYKKISLVRCVNISFHLSFRCNYILCSSKMLSHTKWKQKSPAEKINWCKADAAAVPAKKTLE